MSTDANDTPVSAATEPAAVVVDSDATAAEQGAVDVAAVAEEPKEPVVGAKRDRPADDGASSDATATEGGTEAAAAEGESALKSTPTQRIREQVEYYFSDSNSRDKFLRGKVAEDPEGWVDISVLLTFARLQELTTEVDTVAQAMKESTAVEVSEDGKRVRRSTPWPEGDPTVPRSVHVRGIPPATTWEQLKIDLQADGHGVVRSVHLLRHKGTAFVEFGSEEEATAFASKTDVVYKGSPLAITPKQLFLKNRADARKAKEDAKAAAAAAAETMRAERMAAKTFDVGKIVRFKGIGADLRPVALRGIWDAIKPTAYVDIDRGATEGHIRFLSAEDAAAFVVAANEAKLDVGGSVGTYEVLEGEEEKTYWKKVWILQEERRSKFGRNGRSKRRG